MSPVWRFQADLHAPSFDIRTMKEMDFTGENPIPRALLTATCENGSWERVGCTNQVVVEIREGSQRSEDAQFAQTDETTVYPIKASIATVPLVAAISDHVANSHTV